MTDLRAPRVNKVFLVGNLTRDPELRRTSTGTPVVNFSIALNRRYRVGGEWREDTYFFNIVAWYRLAELCEEFLHKGSAVYIEGELQSRVWEKEDGFRINSVEIRASRIQFLDKEPRLEHSDALMDDEEFENT